METQIKTGTLIIKAEKLLLIKEWSNSRDGYYWNIIKGTFDPSKDNSLIDTAKREAIEEACANISITNFVNVVIKHGFSTRVYVNLVGTLKNGKPHLPPQEEQKLKNEDITEINWFTKDELRKLKEEEFINDVVFDAVSRWLADSVFPLNLLTEINLEK